MSRNPVVALRADASGNLALDALRPAALRAGRLAEALFGAIEADVVVVNQGKIWRGKPVGERHDDGASAEIALSGDDMFWVADTHQDLRWRGHPQTLGPEGIRFCAGAPIRVRGGFRLGALRVFDTRPRDYDVSLANLLKDLAATVAGECERLIAHDSWTLRGLFDQSPAFMLVLDGPDYICEMRNQACVALLGPRTMLGLPLRQAAPELIDQGILTLLDEVFRSGKPYLAHHMAITLRGEDGLSATKHLDFVLQPMLDEGGSVYSIIVQGTDVTVERRASEALEKVLTTNQAIFDNSLDVICTVDADGIFTQVNRRAVEVFGYTPEELVGRHILEFVLPADQEATRAEHAHVVEGRPTSTFQNRYVHKDGSTVPLTWSSVWSPQQNSAVAIARDMRQIIVAEEKLRQAQRIEAVGRLTGGVAHDFNNLLTVVIGGAENLIEENSDRPPVVDLAELIRSAGERGAELTQQLLAFARRQPLEPRSLEIREQLADMRGLLERALGADVDLLVSHATGEWRALADPAQLESAVLNLAINARDAMPLGGKLTIETANVTIDRAYSEANEDIKIGEYVVLAVSDNGEGMSRETADQACEPFFTTKAPGKGSGLGLSMAHGFAKQSNGNLKIYSELGVGTTIKLYLPRADSADVITRMKSESAHMPRGSERILVVEDDSLLRGHAERQLSSLGYTVHVAGNGPEALDMLEHIGELDLLFTDVVMPGGLNGRELATQVLSLRPGLKILYASGYTENAIVHQGRLDAGVDLLHKPYRKRELALKVREVLDQP